MTAPRQVLAGTTYLVTRRCCQREFLLRPSAVTNGVFQYVLAVAASRFGVLVHAYCVLSNHYHLLVTDPHARLPAFEQYLDSLVARVLNVSLGRSEAFWASTPSYSAVTLVEPGDVLDKAVYVLANPVAAGLVRSGREWPGLWSPPEQIGAGTMSVQRPDLFFRKKGPMPETVELELTAPPGFDSVAEFQRQLIAALAARERELGTTMEAEGREFMGATRVLSQSPASRPADKQRVGGLNPRIAARDKWKRIEALLGLVAFRNAYRAAYRAMRKGEPGVCFPHGTYWLRIAHGVACGSPA